MCDLIGRLLLELWLPASSGSSSAFAADMKPHVGLLPTKTARLFWIPVCLGEFLASSRLNDALFQLGKLSMEVVEGFC